MCKWLNYGILLISTSLEKDTPRAERGRKQGRTEWGRLLHPLGDQLGEGDCPETSHDEAREGHAAVWEARHVLGTFHAVPLISQPTLLVKGQGFEPRGPAKTTLFPL